MVIAQTPHVLGKTFVLLVHIAQMGLSTCVPRGVLAVRPASPYRLALTGVLQATTALQGPRCPSPAPKGFTPRARRGPALLVQELGLRPCSARTAESVVSAAPRPAPLAELLDKADAMTQLSLQPIYIMSHSASFM